MKNIGLKLISAVVVCCGIGLIAASPVGAVKPDIYGACQGSSDPICASKGDSIGGLIVSVINVMLYAVGVIAVIMIIYGGIRYTTSAGDTSKTTAARHTITYAVAGLVVAIFAWAIVNFAAQTFIKK